MFTLLCYNDNGGSSWLKVDIAVKYINFDKGMIWEVNF